MCRKQQDRINDLLIRWHRWTSDPMRSTDRAMREFDKLVGNSLWPYLIRALILEARNLACGSAVWSSVRVPRERAVSDARSALEILLSTHQAGLLGNEVTRYNERGNRIGESNHQARLTDHEVDLLREMREERRPDGRPRYSLGYLSRKFKQPKSTVSDICSGRRRAQTPVRVVEN